MRCEASSWLVAEFGSEFGCAPDESTLVDTVTMRGAGRRWCPSAFPPSLRGGCRSTSPASTVRPSIPGRSRRAARRSPAGKSRRPCARAMWAKSTADTCARSLRAVIRARARIRSSARQSPRSVGIACTQGMSRLARRLVDRTRGAHLRGEKVLQLAFARIAQPDAHLLALRRRINFDAAARGELGHRLKSGK